MKAILGYIFIGMFYLLARVMFFIYFVFPLVWLIPVGVIFLAQRVGRFVDSCIDAAALGKEGV